MKLYIILLALLCASCAPTTVGRGDAPFTGDIEAPKSTRMLVDIPELDVHNVHTTHAAWDSVGPLRHGFLHVRGTGFPWQAGANVYLAGHDLGFPATDSWRLLWNLRELEPGDRIELTDANGVRYEYRVYKQFEIYPHEARVLLPVAGKDVVTLQSCVPHFEWSKRLIVRGELVKVVR
jgi:sortase A